MSLSFLKGLLELCIVGKIILVFSSLVTLSLGIWLFTKYYQAAKLQKIIMQELPFEKFYQISLNALAKKQYQIATFTKKFNLFPRMGVPNTKDLKEDYVINFYEKMILITNLEFVVYHTYFVDCKKTRKNNKIYNLKYKNIIKNDIYK